MLIIELTGIIGKKLKYIRSQRGLSLDKVVALTGVSKAMLGQIERGESNPTVATLWKIATGLKVSFSYFLDDTERGQDLSIITRKVLSPVIDEDGMKVYPLFPFNAQKGFEVFSIELAPGCIHSSEPHDHGVEEYVVVTEGAVEIVLDKTVYAMNKGDALRYFADQAHIYRNVTERVAVFQNLIYYSGYHKTVPVSQN